MKTKLLLLTGLAGSILTLAACNGKEPGADSVATVNGYEVTLAELNHELSESGVTDTSDPAVRNAALQAIINRKLLADMAEENELDRTPDFILKDQRMHDVLLADAAVQSLAPQDSRTSSEAIDTFIETNLSGGKARTIYAIDGLQFARPASPQVMDKLSNSNSFDEIVATLREAKISPNAGRMNWDSASMPSDLVRQLNALPAGEPFLIPEGDGIVAGVIRAKQSQPLDPQQARAIAQAAVGQQTVRTRVTDWLEQARASATIAYADGFGPAGVASSEATAATKGTQGPPNGADDGAPQR